MKKHLVAIRNKKNEKEILVIEFDTRVQLKLFLRLLTLKDDLEIIHTVLRAEKQHQN